MRFIGLRHGQSTYNLRHLCNDDPARAVRLTQTGVAQARAAIPALQQAEPAAIYCSPLPRTVQTAQIVNAALRLPLYLEPALGDIRTGFDGRPVADYLAAIAHDPLHARHNGGESLQDHAARVSACLQRLADQGLDNLLLVAHEETLRVCKAWAEGLPLRQVLGMPFRNCEPCLFDSGNTHGTTG